MKITISMLLYQDLGLVFYTFVHLFISWGCKDGGQRGCSQRGPSIVAVRPAVTTTMVTIARDTHGGGKSLLGQLRLVLRREGV